MFNLEQAIEQWRKQMLAAGIKSPEVLEELEAHLREEFGLQLKSGVDANRAFVFAVQEIGRPHVIKNEFKKIGTIETVLEWLMIAICVGFMGLIVFLGTATVVMCFDSAGERMVAGAAMVSTMVVGFAWRYAVPFLPVIAGARKRALIALACIAMGFMGAPLYLNFILPLFATGDRSSVFAGALWAVFIIAIFLSLGVGLGLGTKSREVVSRRRSNLEMPTAA